MILIAQTKNKMPRRRNLRRVGFMPKFNRFAPIGPMMPEEIILTITEFEAIRLKDFLGFDQEKAAEQMNISQPTFHRLINEARKKVADALINNKIIKIQGGEYEMVQPIAMQQGFGVGRGAGRGRGQAGRGMGRGAGRGFGAGAGRGRGAGPSGICKCPKCGYEEKKIPGVPCSSKKCPKCGTLMVRE